ncbi:hypothetical protein [Streptomyces sp. NPDC047315]|uniref:hypothetical protein n=1 Tax=Streptomyces sp. NPDC047315 TaxID=3155142 RepID=UPI0033D5C3DD
MPAHPNHYQRLATELATATRPARRDELLDEWLDWRDLATEWDAQLWGFDPDRWCAAERAAMERCATTEEPTR